jgi:UrcA family protein
MNRSFSVTVVAVVASGFLAGLAAAQNAEEVTVTASRVLTEAPAGHTASGIPINDISLSYGVSYAGLDLASHSGAVALEKRVHDAALAACKEIARQKPLDHLTPDNASCASTAADKAMPRVHELVAAAEKQHAK